MDRPRRPSLGNAAIASDDAGSVDKTANVRSAALLMFQPNALVKERGMNFTEIADMYGVGKHVHEQSANCLPLGKFLGVID